VCKRCGHVSPECSGVHEWCEKEGVVYPGSVLEYMSGVKKRKSCIPGVF
jgi:hypothetical protein